MTFQFKVYCEDDSRYNYGKIKHKTIRARSREKAMKIFREKFGITPIEAI